MLYQAAVILTYPVMLERALTPCALGGPARPRPCRYWAWSGGTGVFGGDKQRGGTAEATAAAQPDTSLTWWQLNLSGSIHQRQGWGELEAWTGEGCSSREGLPVCVPAHRHALYLPPQM